MICPIGTFPIVHQSCNPSARLLPGDYSPMLSGKWRPVSSGLIVRQSGNRADNPTAERRLGELMLAQKESVGLAPPGGEHGGRRKIDGSRGDPSIQRPTLAEAGIDKHL